MLRRLVAVSAVFLPACALFPGFGGVASPPARAPEATARGPVTVTPPPIAEPPGDSTIRAARNAGGPMNLPGDYAVYRLTGTYRREPVTITQRVVERKDGIYVLEMSIEENASIEQYRLRIDDFTQRGEILDLVRIEGGVAEPFPIDRYEARMLELVPAADDNEGAIGESEEIVKVGTTLVHCRRTDYRVRIGEQRATMSTLGVSDFPGENLGGKIVTDDGTVFYQAHLLDLGNRLPNTLPSGRALASSPSELWDEIEE